LGCSLTGILEVYTMQHPLNVGVIGCGNISGIYLRMSKTFKILRIAALADLELQRAQHRANEHQIEQALSVDEMLADPSIDIILNITPPGAHAEIALRALEAGKSVYNEKPLAIQKEDASQMLQLAREKGLRVGCAPDTFLGAGHQTCRRLIDEGAIGTPVAATAFMLCPGHESWHPDPEFYYQAGGGPLFDMGPYYLTALINMLGAVKRVTGSTRISFPERTITSQPKHGEKIRVETPTHLSSVLDFKNGAIATLVTSFDVWAANVPAIEIYGSLGTLSVPDPNNFGGPVRLWRSSTGAWEDVPLVPGWAENSRSIGLADMAQALISGRSHRASGELAFHVLDIIHAVHDASRDGKHIELSSGVDRPAPLPLGLPPDQLDD
jgi:predicted dehydrogenase